MYRAQAPANIAFIKYWGQKDAGSCIPYTSSISMTLDTCLSTSEVKHIDGGDTDSMEVEYYQKKPQIITPKAHTKSHYMLEQIQRIRNLSNKQSYVHIMTKNTFPESCGIASSASSFAAATLALCKAFDLDEYVNDRTKLSKLIRVGGSGSAVRSSFGGFVEFTLTDPQEDSCATQIADKSHWDLCDIICVVDKGQKKVSSTAGHRLAETSPYFQTRIQEMQARIELCKQAILDKDFSLLGRCIEEDSVSMHMIMMTSKPSLWYWTPQTLAVIQCVQHLREEGLECYHTIDAGANVHVICEEKNVQKITGILEAKEYVLSTIIGRPCAGVQFLS